MLVLIVEDDKQQREGLTEWVQGWGFETVSVASAEGALRFLKKAKEEEQIFVILDLGLPGMDGVEFSEHLRERWSYKNIHILAISGRPDSMLLAYQAGEWGKVNDFMPKPLDQTLLHLKLLMAESGLDSIQHLVTTSTTDELTGILNRREIMKRLNIEMERARRKDGPLKTGPSFAAVVVDVDDFKWINDTYGHPAGDEVLKRLASILEKEDRLSDEFGRIGGDEFLGVFPDCDEDDLTPVLNRIKRAIQKEPIEVLPRKVIHITVSMGVAVSTPKTRKEGEDAQGLYRRADRNFYLAKEEERTKSKRAVI